MKGKLWWTFEDANDLLSWIIDKDVMLHRVWSLPGECQLQVEFSVNKDRAAEILGLSQPPDEEEWIE